MPSRCCRTCRSICSLPKRSSGGRAAEPHGWRISMATTSYESSPAAGTNGDRESQSAFGLLRRLTDELSTLLRQELALATALHPWLAALVIGAAVAAIGIVLVLVGIRALDPSTLKPSRTAESLRRDKDVITRRQP